MNLPDCAGCGKPVDAINAAYVITEFVALGEIAVQHALCSPACLIDYADAVELALHGGATQ